MASGSSKSKHTDVNTARNKLDGVLQTLMVKVEESSDDSSEDDQNDFEPEVVSKETAQPSTPSKRGSKMARKRKRKDDTCGKDTTTGSFSYVTKLYDRSVDLAKFSESTPLYPICRAWMLNEPQNQQNDSTKKEPVTSNNEDDLHAQVDDGIEEDQYVTELPSPLKVIKCEDTGTNSDMRIPPLLSPPRPLTNLEDPPSKDLLLSDHMARWKEIRQRWREASFNNEERYKDSLAIIKSLKVVFE